MAPLRSRSPNASAIANVINASSDRCPDPELTSAATSSIASASAGSYSTSVASGRVHCQSQGPVARTAIASTTSSIQTESARARVHVASIAAASAVTVASNTISCSSPAAAAAGFTDKCACCSNTLELESSSSRSVNGSDASFGPSSSCDHVIGGNPSAARMRTCTALSRSPATAAVRVLAVPSLSDPYACSSPSLSTNSTRSSAMVSQVPVIPACAVHAHAQAKVDQLQQVVIAGDGNRTRASTRSTASRNEFECTSRALASETKTRDRCDIDRDHDLELENSSRSILYPKTVTMVSVAREWMMPNPSTFAIFSVRKMLEYYLPRESAKGNYNCSTFTCTRAPCAHS